MLNQDNPAIEAADLHSYAESGQSFVDDATDFVTKGIPLAIGSGLASMANTGIALGNSLGGDFEKLDYEQKVREYDDDLAKYYTDHQEGIDLGGFVATSFIPGTIGLKALKVIQAGNLGKSAASVTGLFRNAEEAYLKKALSSVQAETNQVFRMMDGNKIASIAAGFGEQTLQAASFETAVMLSMNQNPTISKEDHGYFETFLYNSPEILKGALLGGAVGGGINALGISGKIKGAIRARDKEDFPSLNIKEAGLSDIDEGTLAALDYYWLRGRQKLYASKKDSDSLNDREISNYEKTIKQKSEELQFRIKDKLTEEKDASLAQAVYKHLETSADLGGDLPEEVGLRLLGAATNISRISVEDSTASGVKFYLEGSPLSERHAKNFIKNRKDKMVEGTHDTPDSVLMEEWKLEGKEFYQDSGGNYRVIPGTQYAKSQLNKALDTKSHDFIVKLNGDQAGRISENAYPVLGDLGDVRFDRGRFTVNGVEWNVKPYNPLENEPIESSANFLRERLAPKFSSDLGTVEISVDNLPRLDKAFIEGYEDVLVRGKDGEELVLNGDTLKRIKLEKRQELVDAGHDFGRISRELNVSQEFAETGNGEFVLGKVEDHAKPMHARMEYNTALLPDKNYLRGVNDLMTRVQLAKQHNAKVAAMILGEAYNELPKTEGTMLGINTIPELGNFVKSADEFYGSFGQLMQSVGKIVDREIRTRVETVLGKISAAHAQIEGDENLTASFNILVAKLRASKEPMIWLDSETLIPQSAAKALSKEDANAEQILEKYINSKEAFKVSDPALNNYLRLTQEINAKRVEQINAFFAAKGSTTSWDPSIVYVPPINTRKYPYVAFVKERMENDFRPVSVITAHDAQSLEEKIRSVKQEHGNTLDIYTKSDVETFYKLRGEYESGLLLGNSTVDNALKKKGVLSDFAPRSDNEILKDFADWHVQQEQALVRNGVELQYAQEFAELRAMGKTFLEFQKSKFGREFTTKELADFRKENPYEKYIDTALAISNQTKYDSVWGKVNSGVESLGRSMFQVWDSLFSKANKGEISWEALNNEASSYGFRPPFQDVMRAAFNPLIQNKKVVEPIVAKVNSALATTVLRLDPLNSIVNILGTPALIMAELRNITRNLADPDKVGKLSELLSVGIPGGGNRLPSSVKLISTAFNNFIKDDGSLLKYYQEIGAVRSDLKLYKDVLDASVISQDALKSEKSLIEWGNNVVKKTTEMGATFTGNNLSERMVRFVAADIMRQIGEVAELSKPELSAYINTFVNRVHGNYTASQRPALFQGAVGQALSLFQTYQFNVMQNMVRYVEQNDKVAIAALLGLQNTIFGMQGNPAFYLLNSAIGNANREHKDLVTGAYATVGKEAGDWLLYGLGSNALHINLYNRGDLTPRYVTVVPTTLADIPAISIPAKFLNNFVDTLGTMAKGGSLKQSILEGIATNGVNRPIAGVAQLAQGYRTTSGGNLLTAYNDADTWTVAAKLLGGEEMNRSLAIDAYYRQIAYQKKDHEKIADVGEALKNKIRSGEQINPEDVHGFMAEYSRSGGRIDSFNRFMIQNYKDANKSQIEKMKQVTRSPFSKNLSTIMGAEDEAMLYYTNKNDSGSEPATSE